jgi:hypothetical protein
MANAAPDPKIASLHLELARRYEELAVGAEGEPHLPEGGNMSRLDQDAQPSDQA